MQPIFLKDDNGIHPGSACYSSAILSAQAQSVQDHPQVERKYPELIQASSPDSFELSFLA